MMRAFLAFLAIVFATHAITVWYLPRLAMSTAMSRLEALGGEANQIIHVPATDETSRRVVRPSPDLLYSVCLLDLSDGPVRLRSADWGGYMSLSLFAANTDNVFSVNELQVDGNIDLTVSNGATGDVDLGSMRGIAIIRRLATSEESLRQAQAIRADGDSCEQVMP